MCKNIIILLTIVLLVSCKNHPTKEYNSAEKYKKNSQFTEDVLSHYPQAKDSLKRKAALFLIRNIHLHYELTNDQKKIRNQFFYILDHCRPKVSKKTNLKEFIYCKSVYYENKSVWMQKLTWSNNVNPGGFTTF